MTQRDHRDARGEGPRLLRCGALGTMELDRPEALNAIGPAEVEALAELMARAVRDDSIGTILLRGRGVRGFSAGGDIKAVRDYITAGRIGDLAAFWAAEYRLDHQVAAHEKPVVTLAHGLTLGGGMGLTAHARYRVVAADVQLGMPEVLIGLAPDVGMLWRFARAPGEAGTWAALTAARLGAGDALYMDLADVAVRAEEVPELERRLVGQPAAEALATFRWRPQSWVREHRPAIDELFAGDDLSAIRHRVREAAAGAAGRLRSVAESSQAVLDQASPTALAVTLAALRRAERMGSLEECLEQDLVVGLHCAEHPDLAEGIRARVVDKDRSPAWEPGHAHLVGDVSGFFVPRPERVGLT